MNMGLTYYNKTQQSTHNAPKMKQTELKNRKYVSEKSIGRNKTQITWYLLCKSHKQYNKNKACRRNLLDG